MWDALSCKQQLMLDVLLQSSATWPQGRLAGKRAQHQACPATCMKEIKVQRAVAAHLKKCSEGRRGFPMAPRLFGPCHLEVATVWLAISHQRRLMPSGKPPMQELPEL
jgi:hypothetical protein